MLRSRPQRHLHREWRRLRKAKRKAKALSNSKPARLRVRQVLSLHQLLLRRFLKKENTKGKLVSRFNREEPRRRSHLQPLPPAPRRNMASPEKGNAASNLAGQRQLLRRPQQVKDSASLKENAKASNAKMLDRLRVAPAALAKISIG